MELENVSFESSPRKVVTLSVETLDPSKQEDADGAQTLGDPQPPQHDHFKAIPDQQEEHGAALRHENPEQAGVSELPLNERGRAGQQPTGSISPTHVNNNPTVEVMHQKEQLEPMRFGDLITLQGTVKTSSDSDSGDNAIGFLSADPCFSRVGFQQVCPSYSYSSFEQCIFQLCPMLSYDNKASKSKLERRGSFSEEEAMLMDMRIKMEEGKNARQMKGMLVSPELVMYGMSVQLMHLATGMYLTGESFTATEEKDCLRLTLSPGTLTSSFKIMPRFKVRHEGEEERGENATR